MNLPLYTLYEHPKIVGYLLITNLLFYGFHSYSINKQSKAWFLQLDFSIVFAVFKMLKTLTNSGNYFYIFYIFYLKLWTGLLSCTTNTQLLQKSILERSP